MKNCLKEKTHAKRKKIMNANNDMNNETKYDTRMLKIKLEKKKFKDAKTYWL